MKKLITILAIALIAASAKAQDMSKPFIIDTIVKTPYGISLTKAAVQWKQESNYGLDTTITFSFRFFTDTAALNAGEKPISVYSRYFTTDTLGNVYTHYQSFGYERKSYTLAEYANLNVAKMYADVLGILRQRFGNNITQ